MSFFAGIDPSQESFKLDRHAVYELEHFTASSPTINQCIDILDRFLFSNIQISGSTRMFQNYISEYFVPFFRSMLRKIVVLGWSVVYIRSIKDKHTGQKIKIPEVVDVQYINPEIVLDKSTFSYDVSIYDHTGSQKLAGAIFLPFKDIQQVANQTLTCSILSGIVDDFRYIQQVRQFALQAEFVRTNPTIYLEEQKSNTVGTSLAKQAEGLSVGIARNEDAFDDPMNDVNNGTRKNTPHEDLLKNASKSIAANFDFHNKAMAENHRVNVNGRFHQGSNFSAQHKNNIYIVPPGLTLADKPTLPQSGIDFTALEKIMNAKIYQKFGIPESLIGSSLVNARERMNTSSLKERLGTRHNNTNVNVMDIINFETVLDRYRLYFRDAMVIIYEQIYGKRLKCESITFNAPTLYEEYVSQLYSNTENGTKKTSDNKEDSNQYDKPTDPTDEDKSEKSKKFKTNKKNKPTKELLEPQKTAEEGNAKETTKKEGFTQSRPVTSNEKSKESTKGTDDKKKQQDSSNSDSESQYENISKNKKRQRKDDKQSNEKNKNKSKK